jgi:glycosyltransferase involved in cell wall biosynthesis
VEEEVSSSTVAHPGTESVSRVILTIVNDVGPTSMPFNEFVVYRAGHVPGERHVVISWGGIDHERLRSAVPEQAARNITLLATGSSVSRLRRLCRETLDSLRREGARTVVHLHQPKSGLMFHLVRASMSGRVPVLFTVHNAYDKYTWPNRVLSTANYLLAASVTFVSRSAERAYPAWVRRWSRGPARAIPNGVDLGRVDALVRTLPEVPPPAARRSSAGLQLINVGRFVEQKNHRFLIDLLAQLPETMTLTLVGDGPLRPRVLEWAQQRGVANRVRFTGVVPREDVYRELLAADVFVSGSLWEGLPIAVLEAMALRRPVLLSDIGPHREIAEVGDGTRVLPLEVGSWAAELTRWAAEGTQTLAQLGARNRRTMEDHLSLERMHRSYTRVYEELTASTQGEDR